MLERNVPKIFLARLVIGLAQGLALYLLYYAFEEKFWPANDANFFAPLMLVALYVPLLALQGIGNMRRAMLLVWLAFAVSIAAGFAWYDVWHAWPTDIIWQDDRQILTAHITPSVAAVLFTAVFLFIIHALVSCGDADKRIVARYPVLFDLTWKQGVQLAIAVCFVAAFWIVLYLGVALFNMIKLDFFQTFIEHKWFAIPASTLIAAIAIHITDSRVGLVRGVRSLALMLLGWLLPVIAVIALMFLISLVFTGLNPLWETRWATALLIFAAFVLVVLINAAYQDGNPEQRPHHIERVAGTIGSALLVFVMALAGYALFLRIDQYGLTVDRIDAAAFVLVMGFLSIGYLVAAVLPGLWLKLIERWNVYTTFLTIGVLFVLFTPIADPMRLSVNDQMRRLDAGLVKPENFDFYYLKDEGGRFGLAALEQLSHSSDADMAKAAHALLHPKLGAVHKPLSPKNIAGQITVYPKGRTLPAAFLAKGKDLPGLDGWLDDCFHSPLSESDACAAILRDFDGDGSEDILLIYSTAGNLWKSQLFSNKSGHWQVIAGTQMSNCAKERETLLAGQYDIVPPEPILPDLKLLGGRIVLEREDALTGACDGDKP